MPTTKSNVERSQERWHEIASDPALQDLSYKIETNARGQLILSPHSPYHSRLQGRVLDKLREIIPEGEAMPEFPIATEGGVKIPDVVWMPGGQFEELMETGNPPTRAPRVCVEVLSDSNDDAEMNEKRRLYLSAGALEVWTVDQDGTVTFFADEGRLPESEAVPDFPETV